MRFFDRIQNRTALVVSVAGLLPVAILALVVHDEVTLSLRRSAYRVNRALIQGVRSDVDNRLAFHRQTFTLLCRDPDVQSLRRPRLQRALRDFLDHAPFFFKAMGFDGDGRVVDVTWRSHYDGEEKLVGRALPPDKSALSETVRRAMDEGRVRTTPPLIDAFGQSILYFVAPVWDFVDGRKVVGAVAGGFQLFGHEIQALLDRTALPEDGYACLVDDGGRILARRGRHLPAEAASHVWPMVREGRHVGTPYLETERDFLGGRIDMDGREMLVTATRLPSVGLRLIVGQPRDAVVAPARDISLRLAGFAAATLVLSLLLALALSRSLVRPLVKLVEGIRTVGQGKLSHRIDVDRSDELGEAARAFNDMADRLERQRLIEEVWTEKWPGPDA